MCHRIMLCVIESYYNILISVIGSILQPGIFSHIKKNYTYFLLIKFYKENQWNITKPCQHQKMNETRYLLGERLMKIILYHQRRI